VSRRSALDDAGWREVSTRLQRGDSAEQVSRDLAARGIKITGHAIARRFAAKRSVQADVAKTVVREHMEKTLADDLKEIDTHMRLCASVMTRALAAGNDELLLRAVEARRKVLDQRLRLSGADTPDTPDLPTTLFDLLGTTWRRGA
jgi:hypothetical protein